MVHVFLRTNKKHCFNHNLKLFEVNFFNALQSWLFLSTNHVNRIWSGEYRVSHTRLMKKKLRFQSKLFLSFVETYHWCHVLGGFCHLRRIEELVEVPRRGSDGGRVQAHDHPAQGGPVVTGENTLCVFDQNFIFLNLRSFSRSAIPW